MTLGRAKAPRQDVGIPSAPRINISAVTDSGKVYYSLWDNFNWQTQGGPSEAPAKRHASAYLEIDVSIY